MKGGRKFKAIISNSVDIWYIFIYLINYLPASSKKVAFYVLSRTTNRGFEPSQQSSTIALSAYKIKNQMSIFLQVKNSIKLLQYANFSLF